MNWTQEDIDWFDDHISKSLKNGERDEFRAKLLASASKQEAYEMLRTMQTAMRLREMRSKVEMLKEYEEDLKAEENGETPQAMADARGPTIDPATRRMKSRRRFLSRTSIAASILVLVVAGIWFYPRSQFVLGEDSYLSRNYSAFIQHDSGDHSSDRLEEMQRRQERAYAMFELRQCRKAIPYLEELWNDYNDQLALFYLIVCNHAIGRDDKAKELRDTFRNELTREQLELLQSIIN